MENVTGNILLSFIPMFIVTYVAQFSIFIGLRFRSHPGVLITHDVDLKYCDEINLVWNEVFKEYTTLSYKYVLLRAFLFSISYALLGRVENIALYYSLIIVNIIMIVWLMANCLWIHYNADQAAQSVWKTLSE